MNTRSFLPSVKSIPQTNENKLWDLIFRFRCLSNSVQFSTYLKQFVFFIRYWQISPYSLFNCCLHLPLYFTSRNGMGWRMNLYNKGKWYVDHGTIRRQAKQNQRIQSEQTSIPVVTDSFIDSVLCDTAIVFFIFCHIISWEPEWVNCFIFTCAGQHCSNPVPLIWIQL